MGIRVEAGVQNAVLGQANRGPTYTNLDVGTLGLRAPELQEIEMAPRRLGSLALVGKFSAVVRAGGNS